MTEWWHVPGRTTLKWDPKYMIEAPLHWRKGRVILIPDIFADDWTDAARNRVLAIMTLCPRHLFVLITQNAGWARSCLTVQGLHGRTVETAVSIALERNLNLILSASPEEPNGDVYLNVWPLPNLWLGTHVETQAEADQIVPEICSIPAALRFVHVTPRDGIDFTYGEGWFWRYGGRRREPVHGWPDHPRSPPPHGGIDWLIVEGGADPMHPDWVRSLRDQCAGAGVPFSFAGWGAWYPLASACEASQYQNAKMTDDHKFVRVGSSRSGRWLDGVEHNAFPTSLHNLQTTEG